MANKNKTKKNLGNTTIPEAPKAEQKAKETAQAVEVEEVGNARPTVGVVEISQLRNHLHGTDPQGLDANHRVDLIKMIHETFAVDKDAAKKHSISQETIDKINDLNAHAMLVAFANEVQFGNNQFAITMRKTQLEQLNIVGRDMGITFNTKLIEATPVDDNENVVVESKDMKISKEAKEALEREKKALDKKPSVSPTDIQNEEQLADALKFIMADRSNGWEKLRDTITFYRAYLSYTASKLENKDEELKKIKETSDLDLLKKIQEILHECPLVISGMGRSMTTFTSQTKSPISAFCIMRNSAKNRKTGEVQLSEQEIADYTKAIVFWTCALNKERQLKNIEDHKQNLEILNKDKKNNKKAIEDTNEKIKSCENNIAHIEDVITFVSNPGGSVVDELIENYKKKDKYATSIVRTIIGAYYSNVEANKVDPVALLHNVQQRAGVILNMFRDSTMPILEYNEANFVELEEISAESEEKSENKGKDVKKN